MNSKDDGLDWIRDLSKPRKPSKKESRAAAVRRVLAALREAGPRGLRTDDLRDAAMNSHVGGRIGDLRNLGHKIDTRRDPRGTEFGVYVLVREASTEIEDATAKQIRIAIDPRLTPAQVDDLRARLVSVADAFVDEVTKAPPLDPDDLIAELMSDTW